MGPRRRPARGCSDPGSAPAQSPLTGRPRSRGGAGEGTHTQCRAGQQQRRERPARLPGDPAWGPRARGQFTKTQRRAAGTGADSWCPLPPPFRYALTGAVGPAALGALDTAVTDEGAETPRTAQPREGRPLRNLRLARGARRPRCVQRRGTQGGCGCRSARGRRHARHQPVRCVAPRRLSVLSPMPTPAATRPGSPGQGRPLLGQMPGSQPPDL